MDVKINEEEIKHMKKKSKIGDGIRGTFVKINKKVAEVSIRFSSSVNKMSIKYIRKEALPRNISMRMTKNSQCYYTIKSGLKKAIFMIEDQLAKGIKVVNKYNNRIEHDLVDIRYIKDELMKSNDIDSKKKNNIINKLNKRMSIQMKDIDSKNLPVKPNSNKDESNESKAIRADDEKNKHKIFIPFGFEKNEHCAFIYLKSAKLDDTNKNNIKKDMYEAFIGHKEGEAADSRVNKPENYQHGIKNEKDSKRYLFIAKAWRNEL
ncbi:3220_t:CDS:2 [Dentiscutata heterogama]|uniref:3220_t:CDS:1 n=1 Tax=Dentiscutata heterogama TaxID=1316150 RepID=A0ACA9JW79_9GLOM|nr:3220_t:CDS:2 [Dentiscutata heterogama]